ncbi:OsmC-like family protein 3 [Achromobacter xylosoxidans A8]|uniref:OsmC-like family protein 3 n=1 Tax=Achromobacter xylosoxidans (strain A8) TaxID=762376 RepID=E3HJB9_ACHXA|nr:OsmC family protein [Achromobacter xylosoxidans]ADP18019.1 OsmC-like family protein 3 [Achromobacter xylosoxidans A8]
MVTAKRLGEPYGVEVTNGQNVLLSDTRKDGKGGNTGMRPHELLESALAACVCMSIDMAAERAGIALPESTVDVVIERLDHETGFEVSLRFAAALTAAQLDLVRGAAQASPVARTLGKAVRVRPAVILDA